MKYISIDVETTGLDPDTCCLLEIGAIVEDTESKHGRGICPEFHRFIYSPLYSGEIYALSSNKDLLGEILRLKCNNDFRVCTSSEVVPAFKCFLAQNNIEKPVFAGKNVGLFDLRFLRRLPGWESIKHHHRTIDPTLLFMDWENDAVPPDLNLCQKRAGINKIVSHRALDDAWDVIQLLRKGY